MARAPREPDYDDDDMPWLAEVEEERGHATVVPQRRLIGGIAIFLGLLALIVGGLYALTSRTRETGSSNGSTVSAEDVPLIAADPGPYKVAPDSPGGMQVDGAGQTMYATGGGADPGGAIDPNAMPEDPMARPGAAPVASEGAPVDLLPPAEGASERGAIPPAGTHAAVKPIPAKPLAPAPKVIAAAPVVAPRVDVAPEPLKRLPKPVVAAPTSKGVPAPKPSGGSAALQLGAFSTSAKAEAAWKDYSKRFGYLSGLGKSVVKLERDGATLYRLRATGVTDRATAVDLCARMKVAGEACLVAD